MARLQDYAKGLGLADQVEWLGALDATALHAEYAAADVFVQPSKTETFGIVVLEALHTGLPVVATDIPAFEQWLSPERGVRVALDPKEIAQGVLTVWEQGLRVAPMDMEAKKYAPTEVGAQLKEMYARLVRASPGR